MSRSLYRRLVALVVVIAATLISVVVFQATAESAFQDEEPSPETLAQAIEAAGTWLLATHQNVDGGFSSFSAGADLAPSDVGGTLDALWALGAAGADPEAAVSYLEANADQLADYVAQDGSTAGKALLALAPIGMDVEEFAGLDLIAETSGHYSPTGQFGVSTAFNQSLAMMGLAMASEPTPEGAVTWLTSLQASDGEVAGSWDDGFGTAGNVDSTALALVALRLSGVAPDDPVVAAGLSFLEQAQLDSGGWEYAAGFGENANSTAMALTALAALGEDIFSVESRWVKDGVNPLEALLAWQGESGAFQADLGAGPADDFFSTIQALPALGVGRLLMVDGPLQAPVVDAPAEITPTATAEQPTATLEPTATPEPTEAPATETPEAVAEDAASGEDGSDTGAVEVAAENETTDTAADGGGSGSALPWVVGIGAAVLIVGLGRWALSRRQEA